MAIELVVPQVGESITEVQVGDWLKSVGDWVDRDEPVAMIETDKVTVELVAPTEGRLVEIRVPKGGTSAVGEVVGLIDDQAERQASPDGATRMEPKAKRHDRSDDTLQEPSLVEASAGASAGTSRGSSSRRVMPAAKRALHEHGLRAEEVTPSGPGGRLLKEDVERHVEKRAAAKPSESHSATEREEEAVAMTMLRRRVAERLVEAQKSAALLTTFNEVDMSEVVALRGEQQERFQEKYGTKLGFMSFFVKAVIEALKQFPQVNAEVRGDSIVFKNYFDIGVAVGGGRGLVVPVLRNAERLSFADIEGKIRDFSRRAQSNELTLEELQGGTFTISNGGVYGSLLSTPIVNPPQSGVLGLHAIVDRPVVREGAIVVRPMMYVALTYDHRIVDGREAVTFLRRVKEYVEQPARILLEV